MRKLKQYRDDNNAVPYEEWQSPLSSRDPWVAKLMRGEKLGESVDAYGRRLRWTIGASLSRVGRSFSEGGS
jgi:hypothetical protein